MEGTIPTTFIAGLKSAKACIVPKTTADPHMSNFISSIFEAGLIDIPPESNVSPLPTSTFGASDFLVPQYSMTMNLGGSSVPAATPAKAPIPIFVNFARSKTHTPMRPLRPIFRAS